jgi:CheY-like chemotaxis protein
VSEQQGTLINDLQRRVVELQNAINVEGVKKSESHTEVVSEQTAQVESVLWVDDKPKNNSYLIQNLEGLGVKVTTALSTQDALSVFKSGRFQRIITDMGRTEGFVYRRKAGIALAREIRKLDSEIPIIIFCDPRSAENLREEALQAGADDITASATVLLSDLRLSQV